MNTRLGTVPVWVPPEVPVPYRSLGGSSRSHGRQVRGMGEAAWGEGLGEVWWMGVRVGSSFRVALTPFKCVRPAHRHTAVSRSRSRTDAIVTRSGFGLRSSRGDRRDPYSCFRFRFRQLLSYLAVSRMRMPYPSSGLRGFSVHGHGLASAVTCAIEGRVPRNSRLGYTTLYWVGCRIT